MPNPTARTRGRNCRVIRTPPDWGPDIFHPLLLTFDSSEGSGQRYIRPRSPLLARRRAHPQWSGLSEGELDGIPDAFVPVCRSGDPVGRPRGRRVVRLHQPRQPLLVPPLPPLGRPDRVLFPRDCDGLPVPPPRDRRAGVASYARVRRTRALPGVRSEERRPERCGPGGPPPDRAHAEAVAEGDRLRGRPPEGGGRGAVRQPDAPDGTPRARSRG